MAELPRTSSRAVLLCLPTTRGLCQAHFKPKTAARGDPMPIFFRLLGKLLMAGTPMVPGCPCFCDPQPGKPPIMNHPQLRVFPHFPHLVSYLWLQRVQIQANHDPPKSNQELDLLLQIVELSRQSYILGVDGEVDLQLECLAGFRTRYPSSTLLPFCLGGLRIKTEQ